MEKCSSNATMKKTRPSSRAKKSTSLSPETLRIQEQLQRQSKSGRKHWDLFRYLTEPTVIKDALKLVLKNAGSAGIDKVTCARVKAEGEEFVKNLIHKLRTKTYCPSMVRRVYIPKRDGRERPLGIPTVEDRVVQRALVLLLEPIYEQKFLPCSYGFRPGKRAVECVREVAKQTFANRLVFEADIEDFFNAVQHKKLMGMLKEEVVDPRVLGLIFLILRSGYFDVKTGRNTTTKGTPQGGPLSPMLANIYLHHVLDKKFSEVWRQNKNVSLFRYADDFVAVCKTEADLFYVRKRIGSWLKEGGLSLKAKKTRVVDLRNHKRGHNSKFDFLGYKIHLRAFSDNPQRFWVGRQPSEAARKQLRINLKESLLPTLSEKEAKSKLEQVWYGWCEYFRYGNSNRIFYRERNTAARLVRFYLRRKYRHQRKPVPWRQLTEKWKYILSDVKPLEVLN